MTHPIPKTQTPPNNNDDDRQNPDPTPENENRPTEANSSPLRKGIVDNYLIVPQDAPLDERNAVYTNGDLYTILATSQETDFRFNAFDFFVPEGGGPPPHIHNLEHEAFFVEEGQVSFFLGNEAGAVDIPPGEEPEEYILEGVPEGTFIFGPRLRPHGFANPDSNEAVSGTNNGARIFSVTSPGGLDLTFETGIPVEDREQLILPPPSEADPKLVEVVQRSGGGFAFAGYEPPEGTANYILVLPDNTPQELEDNIREQVGGIDGFSVFTVNERPTFTGAFGIEYTSLSNVKETEDEFGDVELSYNQFSLASQSTDPSIEAYLNGTQVIEPTESSATGVASLELNEAGEIEYSLTVSSLDFSDLIAEGNPQTPDNELDDVTAIHIHSGVRGSNGPHEFEVFDLQQQDENDLNIASNDDGSVTVSGIWDNTEAEIPTSLRDFIDSDGLPGTESNFYFQVHTQGNPEGEIRGQIALTTTDFPEPIVSEDYEVFYIREGTLSFQIDDEVRLAEPDTFVYVAPGNEYAIANFGEETVESLAITIPERLEPNTFFGDTNSSFSSPLIPQDSSDSVTTIFLGEDADVFNRPNESGRRVYGGKGNDELFAHQSDRLFGEAGDDLLDASSNGSYNLLDGGQGNDELLGAKNGQLVGGSGDDLLRIVNGGNNLLYGNGGADRFWLVNGRIPDTVTETRQLTDFGLPNLLDTRNTIADFELGIDRIGIAGIAEISSFDDLKLLPAFGDIRSTSIVAEIEGIEGEVSLGNVANVPFNQLSADDFVFN